MVFVILKILHSHVERLVFVNGKNEKYRATKIFNMVNPFWYVAHAISFYDLFKKKCGI